MPSQVTFPESRKQVGENVEHVQDLDLLHGAEFGQHYGYRKGTKESAVTIIQDLKRESLLHHTMTSGFR